MSIQTLHKHDQHGSYAVAAKSRTLASRFSFVISAYNSADTIKECLDSILSQTCGDFEVIVVDDGSCDSTNDIVSAYVAQFSKVVLITQPNMGLTKSLNRAIREACGDFVVRQDADDVSLPERLSCIDQQFRAGSSFVLSSAYACVNDRRVGVLPRVAFHRVKSPLRYFKYANVYVHGTLAARRDLLLRVPYDESYRYSQDYDLLVRLFKANARFSMIADPLYEFRKGQTTISSKRAVEQLDCAVRANRQHFAGRALYIDGHAGLAKPLLKLLRELELLLFR